ncbi:uncharacterized protein LOC141523623 [Macrotis lagotis]|uniref:uncharacterized protein LOC141523623 n=1 Tax=Macrotis lagotis TaxID=92651 RepID=UPI003D68B2EA
MPDPELEPPLHHCPDILAENQTVRPDVKDTPLPHPDLVWFMDRSSFMKNGQRLEGAAVVTDTSEIIWTKSLPRDTSAQKAELIALTKALQLAEGKKVTIYTDSRYAFSMLHVHGALYWEWGFITSEGKEIKHKQEILDLLQAVLLPAKVAVIHVPGHQKRDTLTACGNHFVDMAAKKVEEKGSDSQKISVFQLSIPPPGMGDLPPQPSYSDSDLTWIQSMKDAEKDAHDWYYTANRQLLLPESLGKHS